MFKPIDDLLETINPFLKEERIANEEYQSECAKNMQQDRMLRKEFSRKIYNLVVLYIFVVLLIVVLCGFDFMNIDTAVMLMLLVTTTANVLGIFVIVAKYLFHYKDEHKKELKTERKE